MIEDAGPARPAVRVVRPDATEEEIAALLAVLAAVADGHAGDHAGGHAGDDRSGAGGPDRPVLSRWADRSAQMRRFPAPGPGSWRASAWPH